MFTFSLHECIDSIFPAISAAISVSLILRTLPNRFSSLSASSSSERASQRAYAFAMTIRAEGVVGMRPESEPIE
jgi:hypothetical protein